MRVVYSNSSAIVAQRARDELLAHGILAAVVGRTEGWMAAVRSHDVILCFSKQFDEAREILRTTDWSALPDEALEGAEELPDLSVLDPALAPACPGCAAALPLDAALESCPGCAEPVDVAELIAQMHGPEALAECYEPAETVLEAGALERLTLLCPRCQYVLSGLPRAGACPECGHVYDKDQIVRDFLSR